MRSQSLHPRESTVILDYSRGAVRRVGPVRWLRLFWSHQARLELAQSASCAQGVLLVAAISLVAGFLSTTHVCLYWLLSHARDPQWSLQVLRQQFSTHWVVAICSALIFTPVYFTVLSGLLVAVSKVWTWIARPGRRWSQTFPVLSVGCVPLLWFFVLLQLESIAPFVSQANVWGNQWNPVTNYVRFGALMIGVVLLGLWIIDGLRLYCSLRDRGTLRGNVEIHKSPSISTNPDP